MSDSKKSDSTESQALSDGQLEAATGGAEVLYLSSGALTGASKAVLKRSQLQDVLSRFRESSLLAVERLRPFDRAGMLDIPSSN